MKDWNLTCYSCEFFLFFLFFYVKLEYRLVEKFGNLSILATPQLVTTQWYSMTL